MFDRPVVDSFAFAREAGTLEGRVAVHALARLREALADDQGTLEYRLAGFTNARAKPGLRLRVRAELGLACQRCLGRVAFSLDSDKEFELVAPGVALGDLTEESDDFEQMYADARLDVVGLAEEEAILSLPMVAAHEPGTCEALDAQAPTAAESPFGKLSVLKRQ
jgi:uncharacterized protein